MRNVTHRILLMYDILHTYIILIKAKAFEISKSTIQRIVKQVESEEQ